VIASHDELIGALSMRAMAVPRCGRRPRRRGRAVRRQQPPRLVAVPRPPLEFRRPNAAVTATG